MIYRVTPDNIGGLIEGFFGQRLIVEPKYYRFSRKFTLTIYADLESHYEQINGFMDYVRMEGYFWGDNVVIANGLNDETYQAVVVPTPTPRPAIYPRFLLRSFDDDEEYGPDESGCDNRYEPSPSEVMRSLSLVEGASPLGGQREPDSRTDFEF
ncbi:MAG: hypothetical protein RLN62_04250 [Rickettsiales bacterium]